MGVFVAEPAVCSVVPVSLLVSMVRRVSTRTVDCCLEHERQTSNLLGPPRGERCWVGCRREPAMEVIHSRCAGMDVSKRDAKVCVRVAGVGRRRTVETVTTWASTTNAVLALRDHLIAEQVTLVVMEATSDYWKPFYYLLEDPGFELMLVNARHVKNMPGRKTDVTDAAWLAQLGAHGLVRASFVPPTPIRELRDLTRTRVMLTRERGREIQRLEKLLEDAGIKLSSVATDICRTSSHLRFRPHRSLRPRRQRHRLLVVFAPENTNSFHDYFDLKFELERITGRPVDLVDASAVRNPHFQASALGSAREVYAA